jgi:hypothetical protein
MFLPSSSPTELKLFSDSSAIGFAGLSFIVLDVINLLYDFFYSACSNA